MSDPRPSSDQPTINMPLPSADQQTVDMPPPTNDQATIDLPPPSVIAAQSGTAITALANNNPTVIQSAGTGSTGSRTAVTANDPTLLQRPSDGPSGAHTLLVDPTQAGSASPTSSGSIGRTSMGTGSGTRRTLRTRVNEQLPADTKNLDLKLQQSRVSVFTDMTDLGATAIPPGVQRLADEHGTAGRYAVQRPLAAGGMGAVLEIRDGDFHRRAAMKVIHGRYSKDPNSLERFLAEAQVTAQLEHPNIVPVHDLGVMEDGTLYFTMKLIEGQSFGGVVKKLKAGDAEAKAAWTQEALILAFLKALDGVGFAHSRGVVHRDLKPDNVMIGAHGEVLVVDWGLAKVMADADRDSVLVKQVEQQSTQHQKQVVSLRGEDAISATMDGQIMGTPAFMPPEQARGELDKVDARSDIYSLGAMLYELLALAKPVAEDGGLSSMVQRVSRGDLIPLGRIAPHLHADLVAVVMRALAFERERRYPSCAAFAEDLRRYLAGQAVAARRRSLLERTAAWLHAHRRQVLITAGGIAIATVAAAGATWSHKQAQQQQAAGLMQQAERELAGNKPVEARATAMSAKTLASALPGLAELQDRITAAIAMQQAQEHAAQRERERLAMVEANQRKATELLKEATDLRTTGKPEEAKTKIDSAFELDGTNKAIDQLRTELAVVLKDQQRRKLEDKAQKLRAEGDRLLAQAGTLPLADPGLDDLLKQAEMAYVTSGQDGINIPGTAEQAQRIALLRADAQRARKAVDARQQAGRLTAEAQQALTAGDLDTALARVGAALDQMPGDATADTLRLQIRDAQARKLEQQRAAAALAETLRQAKDLLDAAQRDQEAHDRATNTLRSAATAVERLARLAASDPALAPRLEQARREQGGQQRAAEQAWMTARGRAESARALVAAERTRLPDAQALWTQAGTRLASLHFTRWQTALATGDRAAADALQQAITAYDASFAARFNGPGVLVVTGAAGNVQLQALAHRDDGRFVADGPVRELAVPGRIADLPSGRWQIRMGDVLTNVVLEPGATVTAALPATAVPAVQGHELRWVPPASDRKGFWLGRTEVTATQYEAFLNDPAQLQAITRFLNEQAADKKANAVMPFLPRRRPEGDDISLWKLAGTNDNGVLTVTRIACPEARRREPVTGISRDDAEAFCTWLSRQGGARVRLPTAAEWRWAASGGDPLRRWPWGDVFDPAHTVCPYIVAKLEDLHPLPPGSRPADMGPFGHVDLAGNVREWLADRRTADDPFTAFFGAAVAGGSFADCQPERFRCDAVESVQSAPFGMMGFRILVESL